MSEYEKKFEAWFSKEFPNASPEQREMAWKAFEFGAEVGFDSGITQASMCY